MNTPALPGRWLAVMLCSVAFAFGAGFSLAAEPRPAELPRLQVDTSYPRMQGEVIRVAAGGDLQAALRKAQPGDVIELAAGAEYRGPFTLPRKRGDDWIVIRSSQEAALPAEGNRVRPEHAEHMPVLVSAGGPVLSTEVGAHHYRLVGLHIRPQSGASVRNLVMLSDGNIRPQQMPHHIIFDRCYLLGDESGTLRGIALNSGEAAVIDSHLAGFKARGADSQAIVGWGGSGPYRIANNYLEGAGENLMFGGADPAIRDLVPADIEIVGNHFSKALSWKAEQDSWTIKNLLELKNARRVLIEGNLFEHHWPQAQSGFAILFTVRNQDGAAPWSVVEDVTFVNNLVRHVSDAINVLGRDDIHSSQQTARLSIRNNLFLDIGGDWGSGRLFQFLGGAEDVLIEHNSASHSGNIMMSEGDPNLRFAFRNNIVMHNRYGFIGTGTGTGKATLSRYFDDLSFAGNLLIGGSPSNYPDGNEYPLTVERAGFVNHEEGNFQLSPESRYRGKDAVPGVDLKSLCAALRDTDKVALCH